MALTRLGAASLALALVLAGGACKDGGKKSPAPSADAGVDGGGGGNTDGGATGDGGAARFALALGQTKKAMIGAEGGKIVLETEKFSLEIPKGALKVATEISATPIKRGEHVFAIELKPSGLTFEEPAVARLEVDRESTKERWVAPILFDDDGKPEPVKKLALDVGVDDEPSDLLKVRFEVPHFSVLTLWHTGPRAQASDDLVQIESLAPELPWSLPVGVVFNAPYRASLVGSSLMTQFCVSHPSGDCAPFMVNAEVVRAATRFDSRGRDAVVDVPHFRAIAPREFDGTTPATVFPGFACARTGAGTADVTPVVTLTLRASLPNLRIVREGDVTTQYVAEVDHSTTGELDFELLKTQERLRYNPITCTEDGSIVGAMALSDEDVLRVIALAKPGLLGGCVEHSNGQSCREPEASTWLFSVTDPVLQLGPDAAARMEDAFPCGEGPVGLTLCASGEPFSEGEWVYLAATTLEDLVLDDTAGYYQLAFVFDADGDAANNYVASPSFPKDFFQGTDRWYEALHTPGTGWELKVSDQRQGGSQVASDARFVLAGRQLALFVPRSELGDTPTFRATAFRHEGDWGLSGGPWSASYAPGLMEPLFEAASGPPFALPE